jgi:hypothetical protein
MSGISSVIDQTQSSGKRSSPASDSASALPADRIMSIRRGSASLALRLGDSPSK